MSPWSARYVCHLLFQAPQRKGPKFGCYGSRFRLPGTPPGASEVPPFPSFGRFSASCTLSSRAAVFSAASAVFTSLDHILQEHTRVMLRIDEGAIKGF